MITEMNDHNQPEAPQDGPSQDTVQVEGPTGPEQRHDKGPLGPSNGLSSRLQDEL